MNKQQLASKIWASANKMRSKIEANEYKDYIQNYKAEAKNDQIHRFAEAFGVDEEKLRSIIAKNLPEDNLNQGGYFTELKETVDKNKARLLVNNLKGKQLPPPIALAEADKLLREFIVRGGFDLDEKIEPGSYLYQETYNRMAAEPESEE